MIEEIGTVKSVDGITAMVSVPRKSACEGCTAGICKPEQQSMEIEAINSVGARPGQKVRVSIQTYAYMKGSMLVYGVPALALVLGAFLGKDILSRYFPGKDPDIISALCGFGAFALSFLVIKIWTGIAKKTTESRPVIEEILQ